MIFADLREIVGLSVLSVGMLVGLPTTIAAHEIDSDGAPAHPHQHHENGIGPDPDQDGNPATDTGSIVIFNGVTQTSDDPPYSVINFEKPSPGAHGDVITDQYKERYGVTFFPGVKRQICAGRRHFRYDTECTYEAAPSGRFAVSYLDHLNRALIVKFDKPVCIVTMAIYPTGGRKDEEFELTIQGKTATGQKLNKVSTIFKWNEHTVRWLHMAGAYYLGERASEIAIRMESKYEESRKELKAKKERGEAKEKDKVLRFLIDDFAIVSDNCEAALADIARRDGAVLSVAE